MNNRDLRKRGFNPLGRRRWSWLLTESDTLQKLTLILWRCLGSENEEQDLPTIGDLSDIDAIGTEVEVPLPNNEQKRRRSRDDAETIGLSARNVFLPGSALSKLVSTLD